MVEPKLLDPGKFDLAFVAETIAAAVLTRRHDFMSWQSESQPETLDQEKLIEVIEEEVVKGFVNPA